MASKLFLFSLIMIFLLGFSQANLTKKILENTNFLEMAKLLNQASEDQKTWFYETSFKSLSLAITEALIQLDNEHKNGIGHIKVGITFEEYKDALKRKLEQIYDEKSE